MDKQCARCLETKPEGQFDKAKGDTPDNVCMAWCRACGKELTRFWKQGRSPRRRAGTTGARKGAKARNR